MKGYSGLLSLVAIAATVNAQQQAWQQCGGIGWTGGTTCASGLTCQYSNDWYSQCIPGSSSSTTTKSTSTSSTTTKSTSTSTTTTTSTKTTTTTTTTKTTTSSTSTSTASGGYVQNPSGSASFTHYSGCGQPACGKAASGYTAAISQLAFGSSPGTGPGDACGRCFAVTANADPYSPGFAGPFTTIVVKVTDMCPVAGNQEWCGQTRSNPTNQHGAPVHFDLCEDTGAANVFFPSGHGALTGSYTEVSCSQWSGSDGGSLWNGSCLSGETAPNWPSTGCGNQGTAP